MKVKCNVCVNENNSFCIIKKIKVHINKKRKCVSYVYDLSKLKIKQKIPSVRLNYIEQQNDRRKSKEKLKELKKMVKVKPGQGIAQNLGLVDFDGQLDHAKIKHPLTGDLSRFTTTATKED